MSFTRVPGADALASSAAAALLRQRLADVEGISIRDLLRADPRLRTVSPKLRELLLGAGYSTSMEWVNCWVDVITAGMIGYLTDHFQFVDLRHTKVGLRSLYNLFVRQLLAAGHDVDAAQAALIQHHEQLSIWVAQQLDAVGALDLVARRGLQPRCAYYSPQLQLEVLGLDDEWALASPILDLGCGDGRLVYHLRRLGYEVVGVDRNAPPDLIVGEWFDAPLEPRRWGTIIAHQSVTLHFRSAHLQSESRAADYAELFMRILTALRPGGCFAYAPSVPFFEAVLSGHCVLEHPLDYKGTESTKLTKPM